MDIIKFVNDYVKNNDYPITEYSLVKMIEHYKQAEPEQCNIHSVVKTSYCYAVDIKNKCTLQCLGCSLKQLRLKQ